MRPVRLATGELPRNPVAMPHRARSVPDAAVNGVTEESSVGSTSTLRVFLLEQRVRGVVILWDGADGDERDVLVRVAALRKQQEGQNELPRRSDRSESS